MAQAVDASTSISISIGQKSYHIQPGLFPYLDSCARFHQQANPTSPLTHGPIDLFDEAQTGVEKGFRQCLRQLAPDVSILERLCQTYDFLGVDVVRGRSLSEIGEDLQSCQPEYVLEEGYYRLIRVEKNRARDAVFVLLYVILMDELQDNIEVRQQFCRLVYFVLSNRATSKKNARTVLWAAYSERFEISAKQQAELDNWRMEDEGFDEEDDVTTEVEDDIDVHSAGSAWWQSGLRYA